MNKKQVLIIMVGVTLLMPFVYFEMLALHDYSSINENLKAIVVNKNDEFLREIDSLKASLEQSRKFEKMLEELISQYSEDRRRKKIQEKEAEERAVESLPMNERRWNLLQKLRRENEQDAREAQLPKEDQDKIRENKLREYLSEQQSKNELEQSLKDSRIESASNQYEIENLYKRSKNCVSILKNFYGEKCGERSIDEVVEKKWKVAMKSLFLFAFIALYFGLFIYLAYFFKNAPTKR